MRAAAVSVETGRHDRRIRYVEGYHHTEYETLLTSDNGLFMYSTYS